jgi:uncharacterized metal-binding protein
MPSGITHDRITLWSLPWITFGTYILTRHGEATLLLSGGFLFSGLMFGPDLDIYSLQYKRWGILRCIWQPYRRLCRHRSIYSHGPILGTLLRVFYLSIIIAFWAVLFVAIAQLLFGFDWNWQEFTQQKLFLLRTKYYSETLALFLGLELGAMSHYLSDLIISNYRRQQKKSRIKRMQSGTFKLYGKPRQSVPQADKKQKF